MAVCSLLGPSRDDPLQASEVVQTSCNFQWKHWVLDRLLCIRLWAKNVVQDMRPLLSIPLLPRATHPCL
jgi:hypothetical protein